MVRNKEKRPRIGLALSGGAARGLAHVGVLRALAEHNLPIDCIAGTSAGALVAGTLASGMALSEIESIGRNLRWRDVGRMTMSRMGVQSNERLEQYLRARLPVTRFEELPIPFAAVATDLQSGKGVILQGEGDVPFAIRASCAIPGWYVPVTDEHGRQLVDGGLVANIPSDVARSMGADIVIAVDVNAEGAAFLGPSLSIISVVLQSMMMVQRTASLHQLAAADLVIKPRVGHIRWDEMRRAKELIAAGYEAGVESIPEIERVIAAATKAAPKWYQLRRRREIPTKRPITSLT
ncbi:MAG: patatin-like phospholipase family protein [Pyrinomonadaceae bacterium]|nr:patatin-like phospholipase family protein [Pyrinomonadaceae bacterium]